MHIFLWEVYLCNDKVCLLRIRIYNRDHKDIRMHIFLWEMYLCNDKVCPVRIRTYNWDHKNTRMHIFLLRNLQKNNFRRKESHPKQR